jgi:hypothetical protein
MGMPALLANTVPGPLCSSPQSTERGVRLRNRLNLRAMLRSDHAFSTNKVSELFQQLFLKDLRAGGGSDLASRSRAPWLIPSGRPLESWKASAYPQADSGTSIPVEKSPSHQEPSESQFRGLVVLNRGRMTRHPEVEPLGVKLTGNVLPAQVLFCRSQGRDSAHAETDPPQSMAPRDLAEKLWPQI